MLQRHFCYYQVNLLWDVEAAEGVSMLCAVQTEVQYAELTVALNQLTQVLVNSLATAAHYTAEANYPALAQRLNHG